LALGNIDRTLDAGQERIEDAESKASNSRVETLEGWVQDGAETTLALAGSESRSIKRRSSLHD
jgi:hypothetical protein